MESTDHILVVDDDAEIRQLLGDYLRKNGYAATTVADGKAMRAALTRVHIDLIVLDLMLPETSGWDVCRSVREIFKIPVIMLTARDDDSDKIAGLELGADDYVTKPFNPRELLARVLAVLRRASDQEQGQPRVTFGALIIDPERHEVYREGQPLALTPTEFELLRALSARPGRVFSRLQLLDLVQGEAFEGYERAIDSHIKNLRQKIEVNPRRPRYVLTVFGVGYKFAEQIDEEPLS